VNVGIAINEAFNNGAIAGPPNKNPFDQLARQACEG
jgi:hypothetical protein